VHLGPIDYLSDLFLMTLSVEAHASSSATMLPKLQERLKDQFRRPLLQVIAGQGAGSVPVGVRDLTLLYDLLDALQRLKP
jgi:hypothetical protein